MVGYRWHVRRYFSFSKEELLAVITTAVAGGFIFSFNDWGSDGVDFLFGVQNLFTSTLFVFLLLTFQIIVWKLVGIRYGLDVVYDKYPLGLLIGVFIAFLSFGYLPFFITGKLDYKTIQNLRIGKFRSTFAKNWEVGLVAGAGPLALFFLAILFSSLQGLTGLAIFHDAILIAVLLACYSLLPLPLIQTANPYTVYMSRIEAFEGNVPGFDIFFASRKWYLFIISMSVIFTFFALVFHPSIFAFFLSVILGAAVLFIYSRVPLFYR